MWYWILYIFWGLCCVANWIVNPWYVGLMFSLGWALSVYECVSHYRYER